MTDKELEEVIKAEQDLLRLAKVARRKDNSTSGWRPNGRAVAVCIEKNVAVLAAAARRAQESRKRTIGEALVAVAIAIPQYRTTQSVDADGDSLAIEDILSPKDDGTIVRGIKERDALIDFVQGALIDLEPKSFQSTEQESREEIVRKTVDAATELIPDYLCYHCKRPLWGLWKRLRGQRAVVIWQKDEFWLPERFVEVRWYCHRCYRLHFLAPAPKVKE